MKITIKYRFLAVVNGILLKMVLKLLMKQNQFNQFQPLQEGVSPLIQEARKYKSAEEFVKAQGTPKILSEQFDGIKNITSKSSDVQEIFTHGSYGNKPNPRDIDIAIKLKGSINDSTKLIDEIKDFTRQYAPIKGKDGGFQNAMDITFIDNKGKAFVWDGIEIRPSKFVPIKTKPN